MKCLVEREMLSSRHRRHHRLHRHHLRHLPNKKKRQPSTPLGSPRPKMRSGISSVLKLKSLSKRISHRKLKTIFSYLSSSGHYGGKMHSPFLHTTMTIWYESSMRIPGRKRNRRALYGVWWKRIGIDMNDINNALSTPNSGSLVLFRKSFHPPEGAVWMVPAATDRFGVIYTASRQTNTMILLTSLFTAKPRLVLYLLGTNILPQASGTNEVRTSDLYFLDKNIHGLGEIDGINYGSVILNHMMDFVRNKSPKHAFPYPRLLSLCFEKLGVDTTTVPRTPVKESDKLRQATCGNMGIDVNHPDGIPSPPLITASGDEAETSQAPRPPSIFRQILAELKNINKRLDDSDARFARLKAHFGARPPSSPPDASV
ncbi:hypothetical protein OROGR_011308 [Orobanche gracilis]